jgi:hypothetical protein
MKLFLTLLVLALGFLCFTPAANAKTHYVRHHRHFRHHRHVAWHRHHHVTKIIIEKRA